MRTKSVLSATVLGLLAVGVLLLLAACGGGGDESAGDQPTPAEQETQAPAEQETQAPAATEEPSGEVAGGDIDPCALVTKEEAEAALGASVGEPTQDNSVPSFATCSYETADAMDIVGVSVTTYPDAGAATDMFQWGIDNGFEVVDGVGDRAYRSQPFSDITFQKGKYEVDIDIVLSSADEEFALAKDMAVRAAARMP